MSVTSIPTASARDNIDIDVHARHVQWPPRDMFKPPQPSYPHSHTYTHSDLGSGSGSERDYRTMGHRPSYSHDGSAASQNIFTPAMSKGSSGSTSSSPTSSWGYVRGSGNGKGHWETASYPSRLQQPGSGMGLGLDGEPSMRMGMKRIVIDTDFSNDKESEDEVGGFPLELFAPEIHRPIAGYTHQAYCASRPAGVDEKPTSIRSSIAASGHDVRERVGEGNDELPGRIGDFQTDNMLNAPQTHSQLPGQMINSNNPVVMRYHDEAVAPLTLDHHHQHNGLGHALGFDENGLGHSQAHIRAHVHTPERCPTPIYQHPVAGWNLFGNGLGGWDRESWARRKVAFVTGITGQDGSYLAELLLSKGYTVHGLIRRSSSFNTSRLQHLWRDRHSKVPNQLFLHYGDLTDSANLVGVIAKTQPSEVYNLAAQSHVKVSFEMAEYTGDVDGIGTLRLLEAIRTCGLEKLTKFYQASTSELYGKVKSTPQDEDTPFHPRSPYGVAKLYAYWMCVNYREAYGMFTSNGILFNHESPRRGRTFVTRKITRAVAEIYLGKQDCMWMGNLDAKRDWGHARDYVEGMWRMLQHDQPDDFVLATGETHTVRSLITLSFSVLSIPLKWEGSGLDEIGIRLDTSPSRVVVRIDSRYFRPSEVDLLLGDPSKAESLLGWKRHVGWEELVRDMVESDVRSARGLVEDCN